MNLNGRPAEAAELRKAPGQRPRASRVPALSRSSARRRVMATLAFIMLKNTRLPWHLEWPSQQSRDKVLLLRFGKLLVRAALLCLPLVGLQESVGQPASATGGTTSLIAELGCVNCHADLE